MTRDRKLIDRRVMRGAGELRLAGAVALGAFAAGALAIGALAIGRLVIGRARIGHMEIDELVVRRLRVTEHIEDAPQGRAEDQGCGGQQAQPPA
jgi:hypothetical protein